MNFDEQIKIRSAESYAGFFYPRLRRDDLVLDCGCGIGTITVGLAQFVPHGLVVGVDLGVDELQPAIGYLAQIGNEKVHFCGGSILSLPFADETFSACLCHSSLETLDDPMAALTEIRRVLRAGGFIGAASVEYEGVLLAGSQEPLLRRFYSVREKLWVLEGVAQTRLGKHLRAHLHAAGFQDVKASAQYHSYGKGLELAAFGFARARDCEDPWFVEKALKYDLLTRNELNQIQGAWKNWAKAEDSFAAFTWCHAMGSK